MTLEELNELVDEIQQLLMSESSEKCGQFIEPRAPVRGN